MCEWHQEKEYVKYVLSRLMNQHEVKTSIVNEFNIFVVIDFHTDRKVEYFNIIMTMLCCVDATVMSRDFQ